MYLYATGAWASQAGVNYAAFTFQDKVNVDSIFGIVMVSSM